MMSRFWSPVVHTLKPYIAGEQPRGDGWVKLNTNENPYGPSPLAIEAIQKAASEGMQLYPDPDSLPLREVIAQSHGLDVGNVFIGNGSDEVLAHSFQALLNHEKPLLFPDVSYSFYPTYCRLYGIAFEEIPLNEAMQIDVADYRRACGAIILPNPNAPTGTPLSLSEIETLLNDHPDQVVVIDEAYVDYGAETAVGLIKTYANLLIVQTFSKSRGLAGLRVGFAMGQRPLIEALERVKDSFNSYPLDRLAIRGATASWQDKAWFEKHRDLLIASRETLMQNMGQLGFDILPSAANFIYARHRQYKAHLLLEELRSRKILVRRFSGPRIDDFLRISIGTDQQCGQLTDALHEMIR